MIEIDGSIGEAGGQIIRTAMSLSAITQKPVRITNIRAGRPNPGLQPQHLMSVKAVRNICRGTLEGAEVGSTQLTFTPGQIVGGKYDFNIGTAGSVSLVAQTIIPIALFAEKPSIFRIIGGTHVMKSPSSDYLEKVFVPALANLGLTVSCETLKTGYYPRGGGEIEVKVEPGVPKGIPLWNQPNGNQIETLIRLSDLPVSIAVREKKIFVQNNHEKNYVRQENALDVGNAMLAWSGYRGAYSLGEKSKRAETVAQEAYDAILASLPFDVDEHLADQLLLYAALADGKTEYSMPKATDHLKTNAEIIKKFLKRKIELRGQAVLVE